MREVIHRAINEFLDRLDELRYPREARSRFWRANEGIALVLVVSSLIGLGLLTAMALASPDTDNASVTLPITPSSEVATTEVITETVERGGTVRVVRQGTSRGAVATRTVQDLVTLAARTVRETHVVTTQEIATVTEIQPVTVTVFETVTCKPKSC